MYVNYKKNRVLLYPAAGTAAAIHVKQTLSIEAQAQSTAGMIFMWNSSSKIHIVRAEKSYSSLGLLKDKYKGKPNNQKQNTRLEYATTTYGGRNEIFQHSSIIYEVWSTLYTNNSSVNPKWGEGG